MSRTNSLSSSIFLVCLGVTTQPTDATVYPFAGNLWDYISPCQNDYNDFVVTLDRNEAACIRSYSRCPFNGGSCLGNDDDWMAESGETFEYLETRVFHVPVDSSPKKLYVKDDKGSHACARALFKEHHQDFRLGSPLKVAQWWDGSHPLHITIVPFSSGDGDCDAPADATFDAARALAVWLSPYKGQSVATSWRDGSVYCDISVNPGDCLNVPYWDIDGNQLVRFISSLHVYYLYLICSCLKVLHGTLAHVLRQNPPEVSIYVPEGWDMNIPINNNEIRFEISVGSWNGCKKFLEDRSSSCQVDKGWIASYPTTTKITVSGLGRVNGWNAMKWQVENNIRLDGGSSGDLYTVSTGSDFSWWQTIGEWYIFAHLISLASTSLGIGDNVAIDVSGVEVAWGSKLGWAPVSLNSPWPSDLDTSSHPVKLYDLKEVGMWNGQSDGPDIMGKGSYSFYLYLHTNASNNFSGLISDCSLSPTTWLPLSDDALKIAATDTYRAHSTVLKGNAGCVVILGSYGNHFDSNVDDSYVDGVYVHRIVHNSWQYQGCHHPGSRGGLVCTRSCGNNARGLIDATVATFHVPRLGSANSVSVPFGIGVSEEDAFCAGPAVDPYHIRNLVFRDFDVRPNPSCKSSFYDNSGKVQWGWYDEPSGTNWPSVRFFDADRSDPGQCKFQGAVTFSTDPAYFVCGFLDEDDASNHCMTADGVGSAPNVDYE
ncbi:LOW QUALITY PROTEIN: hypothetical protein ACHAWF_012429, partial [Thalassiosira exigua]